MAIKIIIDALILINIYWYRLFITDQFQLFQQFLKLDNTEYKKMLCEIWYLLQQVACVNKWTCLKVDIYFN